MELYTSSHTDFTKTCPIDDGFYVRLNFSSCSRLHKLTYVFQKSSVQKFKKVLKIKIREAAFNYLELIKKKHSKSKKINHKNLEIQLYLTDTKFTNEEKEFLFKLRTSMNDVKTNFSSLYISDECDLCGSNIPQTTEHLLYCQKILDNCPELFNDVHTEYEHIFGDNDQQLKAVKLYHKVHKVKSDIEDE